MKSKWYKVYVKKEYDVLVEVKDTGDESHNKETAEKIALEETLETPIEMMAKCGETVDNNDIKTEKKFSDNILEWE